MANNETILKIIYRQNQNDKEKLRIFGNSFVRKNSNKCKIIFQNKKLCLKEYFDEIKKVDNFKNLIILKLKGINNITDTSFMFHMCKSLLSKLK